MRIEAVKAYQQQMEIQQIEQDLMELKHQELKIKAEIIDHERMRIRRLDTGARTRGIGTQVDTLA